MSVAVLADDEHVIITNGSDAEVWKGPLRPAPLQLAAAAAEVGYTISCFTLGGGLVGTFTEVDREQKLAGLLERIQTEIPAPAGRRWKPILGNVPLVGEHLEKTLDDPAFKKARRSAC